MTSLTNLAPFLLPLIFSVGPALANSISANVLTCNPASTEPELADTVLSSIAHSVEPRHFIKLGESPIIARDVGLSHQASSIAASVATPLAQPVDASSWLAAAKTKLQSYLVEKDGWKGEGTVAPSAMVIAQADELIEQFAIELPSIVRPMISADDDGSICLFWHDGSMAATVMAHGDNTYSYFAEGYGAVARCEGATVGEPLPAELLVAMDKSSSALANFAA